MGLDERRKRKLAVASVLGSMVVASVLTLVGQPKNPERYLQKHPKSKVQEKLPEASTLKVDPYFCYDPDPAMGLMDDPYVKEMASLKSADRGCFFTCADIFAFRDFCGDMQYAKELASFRDAEGKNFFLGKELVAFTKAGGTTEYAKKFFSFKDHKGNNPFYGGQLPQLYRLGLNLEQVAKFDDTPKPNALLVYPTWDYPIGKIFDEKVYYNGAFRDDYSLAFFKKVSETYDVKVVVASTEGEVYEALDSEADFKLFILSGHGTKTTLSLGEKDLRVSAPEKNETYTIDLSDSELEKHLQKLAPDAVIFLNSCSTAEGGAGEKNLANKVNLWAQGRKVIAPTKDLRTGDVQIDALYPFKVTLFYSEEEECSKPVQERKREDITYTIKSKF